MGLECAELVGADRRLYVSLGMCVCECIEEILMTREGLIMIIMGAWLNYYLVRKVS